MKEFPMVIIIQCDGSAYTVPPLVNGGWSVIDDLMVIIEPGDHNHNQDENDSLNSFSLKYGMDLWFHRISFIYY